MSGRDYVMSFGNSRFCAMTLSLGCHCKHNSLLNDQVLLPPTGKEQDRTLRPRCSVGIPVSCRPFIDRRI